MLLEKPSRISLKKKSLERSRMRGFLKHARNFSSVLKDVAVVFADKIAASLCMGSGLDWDKKNGPGNFWSRQPTTTTYIYMIYTTSQSFLNSKIFTVLSRSLFCSTILHLFDHKYSKSSNIVKYFLLFKITVFYKM